MPYFPISVAQCCVKFDGVLKYCRPQWLCKWTWAARQQQVFACAMAERWVWYVGIHCRYTTEWMNAKKSLKKLCLLFECLLCLVFLLLDFGMKPCQYDLCLWFQIQSPVSAQSLSVTPRTKSVLSLCTTVSLPRCMECNAVLRWDFCPSVRLSVCLSVKRVHCDKTEESYV